jgi:hypothetical protein
MTDVFFFEVVADSSRARRMRGKPTLAKPATPSCRKLRRDMPSQ